MMRIELRLLSVLVVLSVGLLESSCAHALGRRKPVPYTQPERASCMVGESGCVCFDPRLPECPGEITATVPLCRNYVLSFEQCRNYIVYHPSEYDTLQEWISDTCFGRPRLSE